MLITLVPPGPVLNVTLTPPPDVLMPDPTTMTTAHAKATSSSAVSVSGSMSVLISDSTLAKRGPESNEQTTFSNRLVKRARFDQPATGTEDLSESSTNESSAESSNAVSQPTPRLAMHQRNLSQPHSSAPSSPAMPTFWHDDGDLVIIVREDARFRVHAMRLAAASTTFAALLAGSACEPPAPLTPAAARPPYAYASFKDREAAKEASGRAAAIIAERFCASNNTTPRTINNCPVIQLDDDSARDWAVALEASYDFLSFLHRPVIFESLSSALRISTKYGMQFLRKWAITQMRTTWPSNLEQMGPTALAYAAEAIALARVHDVPSILPAAFYALSIQKWRNGSTAQRAQTALSPEDLTALFAGREAIQDVLIDMVASPLSVGDSNSTPATSTVYPPSPAPSPAPKSPTVPSSLDPSSHPIPLPVTPLPEPATPSTSSSTSTSKTQTQTDVQTPPNLTFCQSNRPCRAALCALWRRTLSPDSKRPWGTWIVRELHKLAALPRDTLGATALMNELKLLASNEGECMDFWPDITMGNDCLLEEAVLGGMGSGTSVGGSANASPKLAPAVLLSGEEPPSAVLSSKNWKGKDKAIDVNLAKKLVNSSNLINYTKSQNNAKGKAKAGASASTPVSITPHTSTTASSIIPTSSTSAPTPPSSAPGTTQTEPVTLTPTLSETERGRRAEARAPVCARCWEENRRLARWRLRWMCEAIPGMFGLVGSEVGVGEGEGVGGGVDVCDVDVGVGADVDLEKEKGKAVSRGEGKGKVRFSGVKVSEGPV